VRTNLIVSVHSFATDPLRGLFLIVIIGYLLLVTIKLNIKSALHFNQDTFSLVSKESFLLLNNIFFIASALTVFIGTIYPLFSELFFESSVSIGAPYYNFAFNILMAPIILVMAFAPQVSWNKNENKNNKVWITILITSAISIICYFYFENIYFDMACFVASPIIIQSLIVIFKKFHKDLRFYSQWLAHLSIAIFIIAAVYTEQFDQEENFIFEKNGSSQLLMSNKNNVYLKNIKDTSYSNYQEILVELSILNDEKEYILSPSKNIYQPSGQVTNEVSTVNQWFHQYYATISSIESDRVAINLVYKPMINLLWISAIMLVFSIFLSIIKRR
jgi:cytochrome c-type biogenesis protein CcmF